MLKLTSFLLLAWICASLPPAIATLQTSPAKPPGPSRPSHKLQLTPCEFSREALCGKYQVFENRAAQAGRQISLDVVVLSAQSAQPAPDPVFFLTGGPGQDATDNAPARSKSELRRTRDLVFVSQRGAGTSHLLDCDFGKAGAQVQSYFQELFPLDQVRACRARLAKMADLRFYTTPVAMADLDEVRAALGYDQINLHGVSYGTLAALEYLRQYPTRVRAVVLNGVATPAMKSPLHFAKGAQAALDQLLEDCAADESCNRAFPQLKAEWAAVLARFDKGPVSFELAHPVSRIRQRATLTRSVFAERLRLLLYNLSGGSRVPLLIHLAAQGDFAPFGTALLTRGQSSLARGMYLTVTCSESIAAFSETEIRQETSGTFVGDARTRLHARACREWPRGQVPEGYYEPVRSTVPVLMFSGALDPATPPQFGHAAAQHLPNSRQVLIRNKAHGDTSGCIGALIVEFIAKGSAKELDTTCVERFRRPSFLTTLPEQPRQ
ncbi:MAG: alpha/beta fold hydrolase [Blastocatellia bacterium]